METMTFHEILHRTGYDREEEYFHRLNAHLIELRAAQRALVPRLASESGRVKSNPPIRRWLARLGCYLGPLPTAVWQIPV